MSIIAQPLLQSHLTFNVTALNCFKVLCSLNSSQNHRLLTKCLSSASKTTGNIPKMIKAPAAERNKDPILDVLKTLAPSNWTGKALEIASGTGQHVCHFASYFGNLTWQPSEYDKGSLNVIRNNISYNSHLTNILDPVQIDVTQPYDQWPIELDPKYQLIVCINMIHISPWQCTIGLLHNSSRLLAENGYLVTYGPYSINGLLTPESNVAFNDNLRHRNPEWGIRDVKDIEEEAQKVNLHLIKMVDMPANNKTLVFQYKSSK